MGKTLIEAYKCDRCEHVWLPRIKVKEPPIICPKCKSYYWNKPTREELSKTKEIARSVGVEIARGVSNPKRIRNAMKNVDHAMLVLDDKSIKNKSKTASSPKIRKASNSLSSQSTHTSP